MTKLYNIVTGDVVCVTYAKSDGVIKTYNGTVDAVRVAKDGHDYFVVKVEDGFRSFRTDCVANIVKVG